MDDSRVPANVRRRRLKPADLRYMNLPEDYWRIRVQGVGAEVKDDVLQCLRSIDRMRDTGAGVLIYGNPGVGKTGIAALIAKEARALWYSVYFTRIWELRDQIARQARFDDDRTVLDRAREVDVLVLDELQAKDAQARFFPLSEVTELIMFRGAKRLITVVTLQEGDKQQMGKPPWEGFLVATTGRLVPFCVTGPNRYERRGQALARVVFGKRGR